jgi:ATP-dependent DNA helicase RecG
MDKHHAAVRALATRGLLEYTIPEKPNSRLQKYRLTGAGLKTVGDKRA